MNFHDSEIADSYHGLRVAVFGASGFIGRWVARLLSLCGAEVYLIIRDRESTVEILSEYNIKGEIITANLQNLQGVKQILLSLMPSIVFNLAGYGVDPFERDEKIAYRLNSDLVQSICESVVESRDLDWDGQDLIHVGSALEYGDVKGSISEETDPFPTTLYGKSKLAGTQMLTQCCERFGLKGLTARLFTVYGFGEHSGRLLPSLLRVAQTGENLQLTAGGQKRDFTYVEDVAEGLLRLGLLNTKTGEVVNLATGILTSVRQFTEVATTILDLSSDQLKYGVLPMRDEEMEISQVLIKKLERIAGWVPETSISDGIQSTLNFKEMIGNNAY